MVIEGEENQHLCSTSQSAGCRKDNRLSSLSSDEGGVAYAIKTYNPPQRSLPNTLPRKILIIGVCGAGKSTLASQVSRILNVPRCELDAVNWMDDWKEKEQEHFYREVEEFIKTAENKQNSFFPCSSPAEEQNILGTNKSTDLSFKPTETRARYTRRSRTKNEDDAYYDAHEDFEADDRGGWCIDGNYTRHLGTLTFDHADTIVWLRYSLFSVIYPRLIQRSLQRIWSGEKLFGTNCTENVSNTFCSRDSLLLYAWTGYKKHLRTFPGLLENAKNEHGANILIFDHPQQTEAWLEYLSSITAKRKEI